MKKLRRATLLVLLLVLAVEALWAWPWSRDMIVQPIIRPLLVMLRPAAGAVAVGSEAPMAVAAADSALHNPLAATPENLAAGKKLYSTFCYPCHGTGGEGDGSVAGGALAPANLASPLIQHTSDGHIYGVMRNGLRAMVQYHEGLSPRERWLVVLHVRTLAQPGAGPAPIAAQKPQ